ncbi:MAG: hypothetical protein AMXMBFR72_11820 [Betaproteobacteria bacterium]
MRSRSPKQLRNDITTAAAEVENVRQLLLRHENERHLALGYECVRTANALESLLREHQIPSEYKVAVVGRFKAGKSSFVNELLGRKLAGEDTSPETAAVTTFRHGDQIRATIRFLPRSEWQQLKEMYEKDPKDPEAQRYGNWVSFPKRKPAPNSPDQEVFDEAKLGELERKYLADPPASLPITLDDSLGKKGETAFRNQLKQFTTGTRPHHCLVQSIEITTPSALLEEGVLLIDTPGLDDTERFRVALAEQAVQDVDAVLFLTKSGASYGQAEKDFLLSVLRRGTVKQLMFVVTQVDHTYQQHYDAARQDDEDPHPIARRIEDERRRLRSEIDRTLTELVGDGAAPAMERYREQLGEVEIAFTSASNHRKWQSKDPVPHPLTPDDPGGMLTVREALLHVLSTESRLAAVARAIEAGAIAELEAMVRVVESRRAAVHSVKDKEVAERKLGEFRAEFGSASAEFEKQAENDAAVMRKALETSGKLAAAMIENIALTADSVLGRYETDDAGRHWRTRRSGYWGYMHALQTQVANTIFPRVAALLNEQQGEFVRFVEKFKTHLAALARASQQSAGRLEIGTEIRVDVAGRLDEFLGRTLANLNELVQQEEDQIVALLDDFVTEEVEERISEARRKVTGVWGAGTTVAQTQEVKRFYSEVRAILKEALAGHLRTRHAEYGGYLVARANELPALAVSEARAELKRVEDNIKAAAEAAARGSREAFDAAADSLLEALSEAMRRVQAIFARAGQSTGDDREVATTASSGTTPQVAPAPSTTTQVPPSPSVGAVERPKPDAEAWERIRSRATRLVERFRLVNGTANWSLARLFPENLIKDAQHVLLIDPYLNKSHQLRNLNEFIAHVRRVCQLKSLYIVTGKLSSAEEAEHDGQLRTIAQDLAAQGIDMNWDRDGAAHDRFALFDHGVLYKLGIGLDIFKAFKSNSLPASEQTLRRVKECEIDVFRVPA